MLPEEWGSYAWDPYKNCMKLRLGSQDLGFQTIIIPPLFKTLIDSSKSSIKVVNERCSAM